MRVSLASIGIWIVVGVGIAIPGSAAAKVKHEYELAPGRADAPKPETAILIPINETIDVPAGLDVAEEAVTELIVEHLASKGLAVERIEIYDYRRLSSQATDEAETEMRSIESGSTAENVTYSEIVPHLLAALESEVDLVIVPNLVVRSAELENRSARWDGVRRRQGGGRMTWTGNTNVASLFVAIYDRKGARVFSGYGGLDLLFVVNRREKRMDLIEDRLQKTKHLREGVCVAFDPFFGAEKSCR